ncbi:hypothetical protein HBO05_12410 [Pseudomonas sp. WS 5079]|nr:hypothetical protein [Pseudomonas sp. WS 5079]
MGTCGGINQGTGDSVGGGIEPDLGLCNAAAYLGLFVPVLVGWLWLRQALVAGRRQGTMAGHQTFNIVLIIELNTV